MNFAGVELGGTKTIVVLGKASGELLNREVIPTTSADETLSRVEEILLAWRAAQKFEALGIASFGPIDLDPSSPNYGELLATPKPGWPGVNVLNSLRQVLGSDFILDTDVNGAALAEMRWGAGRGLDDFAYITIGTGIGVGLIVDGQPTRGFGHCELGHIRVARLEQEDWPGSCPYHGDCAEGLASGSALKARFGAELEQKKRDDPVWQSVAWTVAQICHAIVCATAPRRIVIGGGVIERQPQLVGMIGSKLVESLSGFIRLPNQTNYVSAPALGRDAGPLGAIALAMRAKPQ
jgi:fructokinase